MRDYTVEPILADAVVRAPIERVFALSTRVELVKETLGMNLVDSGVEWGVAAGHIKANSRVVWRGWKFGLPTEHHTLITGFHEPHLVTGQGTPLAGERVAWFQDSQEKGRFQFFRHDHYFRAAVDAATGEPVTVLHDEVRFSLPFGVFGKLAASLLLAPHVSRLCAKRFERITELAEGEGWRKWLE